MSKYYGVLIPEDIKQGDIIRYATQGTAMERKDNPWGEGYVHKIDHASQKADEVSAFHVLPLVRLEDARETDFAYHTLNMADIGSSIRINPNGEYAFLLAPLTILATSDQLGNKDGLVQRIGNIAGMTAETSLLERIGDTGGDERLYYGQYGAPTEARPSSSNWGTYIPVGIRKDRFEESEYEREPKRTYRKKPAFEGKAIDLDIDSAVERLGLDPDVAALFKKPVDGRVKSITSLRAAHMLSSGKTEGLERYIPKESSLAENPSLEELKDTEIHIGVVNGLAQPREGTNVKPIIDLKSAHELVTKHPENLVQYMYMGPKIREYAIADITHAFNARAVNQPAEQKMADVSAAIKTVWDKFTKIYLAYTPGSQVPEILRGADGQPLWKMAPKNP